MANPIGGLIRPVYVDIHGKAQGCTREIPESGGSGGSGSPVVPDWSAAARTDITNLVRDNITYPNGYPAPSGGFVLFIDKGNTTTHSLTGFINSFPIYTSGGNGSAPWLNANQMLVQVARDDKIQTTGTYGSDFKVWFILAKSSDETAANAILTEDGEPITTEDGEVIVTET